MCDDAAPVGTPILSAGGGHSQPVSIPMSEEHKFAVLIAQMSDEQFAGFLDLIRSDLVTSAAPYRASLRAGLEAASETDRAVHFLPASDHL